MIALMHQRQLDHNTDTLILLSNVDRNDYNLIAQIAVRLSREVSVAVAAPYHRGPPAPPPPRWSEDCCLLRTAGKGPLWKPEQRRNTTGTGWSSRLGELQARGGQEQQPAESRAAALVLAGWQAPLAATAQDPLAVTLALCSCCYGGAWEGTHTWWGTACGTATVSASHKLQKRAFMKSQYLILLN